MSSSARAWGVAHQSSGCAVPPRNAATLDGAGALASKERHLGIYLTLIHGRPDQPASALRTTPANAATSSTDTGPMLSMNPSARCDGARV